MAFLINFAKGVRNHWKKSTLAALAITYGCKYAKESYDINVLMRAYCEKAAEYGQEPISSNKNLRIVTIILNPKANKRKAAKQFEKYCAPILNLAGICVDIIQTESEGHAKSLIEKLSPTDAIVVAGGDGTLSEVVTGLLRQYGEHSNNLLPIGVLPLGRTNTIAKKIFPGGDYLQEVRSLADASLAIVQEVVKPIDLMKIEVLEDVEPGKPVYAASSIEWGAYRDAEVKGDKYWYFGPLRNYVTYLFNGFSADLTWNCEADLIYSLPCNGCSNCRTNQNLNKRWFHRFMPYKHKTPSVDYSKINNEECRRTHEMRISSTDVSLLTRNNVHIMSMDSPPMLQLNLGPNFVDYFDFVSQGWLTVKGNTRSTNKTIEARQIQLKPVEITKNEKEMYFSIDKEHFEVKPVKITLLPEIINMYCKKENIFDSTQAL